MPRTGSRALVLLAFVAAVAIGAAALLRSDAPPTLDPSAEPAAYLDEPASGRLLKAAEVRAQLPAAWQGARIELVRYGELADLPQPAASIHPDRLVWLVVRQQGDAWELRAYDAATGIRLITLEGTGRPSR